MFENINANIGKILLDGNNPTIIMPCVPYAYRQKHSQVGQFRHLYIIIIIIYIIIIIILLLYYYYYYLYLLLLLSSY